MAHIKQKPTLTITLATILYGVNGITDGNTNLQAVKDLFNIGDIEEWQTETIEDGTTEYINIEDGTIYAGIEIDYIIKRTGRGYRTGKITILVDDSNSNNVTVSDSYIVRDDGDDLGLNLDEGFLSSGTIQLKAIADSSDANDVIFNYQIISKRPITVS